MVSLLPVVIITGAVPDNFEGSYGWCGLCQSFTLFPHDCPGAEQPAQEETAASG
jgi:hypothetical protein